MKNIIAAAALTLFATAIGEAQATTVLKVDTHQLATTSEWVVRATVTSVKNVDLRKEGRGIFTDVDLTFTEIYGGKKVPSRYTLRLIGGPGVDGTVLQIPGMPRCVGEDVVLFLEDADWTFPADWVRCVSSARPPLATSGFANPQIMCIF